jgi:hypothetical protein
MMRWHGEVALLREIPSGDSYLDICELKRGTGRDNVTEQELRLSRSLVTTGDVI